MTQENYKQEVRAQYEAYPYPMRDPNDEHKQLIFTSSDQLDLLNHYAFEGKRDFNEARILIAGEGTGDASIFLAEQLRGTNAEIIALDISEASQSIARARSEARQQTNIQHLHGSLLDVAEMDLGMFDYISCTGVLHHLPDPQAGLQALASVLKDDGAMGLMLYGEIARKAIYNMQALMRHFITDDMAPQKKVEACRAILQQMPKSNWVAQHMQAYAAEIQTNGDAAVYDLFLHAQDRAYTIPEVYAFVEDANLQLVDFIASEAHASTIYEPILYLKDQALLQRIGEMDKAQRYAIGEALACTVTRHIFYVSKQTRTPASVTDHSNIPAWHIGYADGNYSEQIADQLRGTPQDSNLRIEVRKGQTLLITKRRYTAELCGAIDGQRSMQAIIDHVIADNALQDTQAIRKELADDLQNLLLQMHRFHYIFLRAAHVPPFPSLREILDRGTNATQSDEEDAA